MKEFELEPGEKVIRETRKHWFIFIAELLPYAILALAPLAAGPLLALTEATASFAHTIDWSAPLTRAFLGTYWLIVWCGAYKRFMDYYLDAWIITNLRIVDINQRSFFHRSVSSLLLNRVQDVTVKTEGFLVSILDIGDINVQSAGAIEHFAMRGVPHPDTLRDIILTYVPNGEPPPRTGL